MSTADIIAALPRLSPEDRAEVQAKLDELAGNAWLDRGELSDAERQSLDAALAEYAEVAGRRQFVGGRQGARSSEAAPMTRRPLQIIMRIEAEVDITDAAARVITAL